MTILLYFKVGPSDNDYASTGPTVDRCHALYEAPGKSIPAQKSTVKQTLESLRSSMYLNREDNTESERSEENREYPIYYVLEEKKTEASETSVQTNDFNSYQQPEQEEKSYKPLSNNNNINVNQDLSQFPLYQTLRDHQYQPLDLAQCQPQMYQHLMKEKINQLMHS